MTHYRRSKAVAAVVAVSTNPLKDGSAARHPHVSVESTEPGYRQELDRALGLRHLLVYGMNFMVPIAPMALYGFVAHESHGMVSLVYLVGTVAMLFTALSYKRLSAAFPLAGSVYSYVRRGWHPYVGFVAGWMILADYLLMPAMLYAFSASWLHGLLPGVPPWIWVATFVVINTAVNILGIRLQASAHLFLLCIELVALAIFLVLAVEFVFIAGRGVGGWSLVPFFQPQYLDGRFIATATSIAVLSFLGFDAISTLAEEVRDPRRTVGNATVLTLLLLGGIFIAQTYVAALAHPDFRSLDPQLGFFQIAREVGGAWVYVLLIVMNVIASGIATALSAQLAISRILYSMGRDRVLPGSGLLSRIHPRLKTPVRAIVLVAALTLAVALLVPEEAVLKLVNFGALTAFMLLNVTVFVYFFVKQRRFRRFLSYLVFPALGLVIVGFVWSGFDAATFLFGSVWLVVGLVVGAFKYRKFESFDVAA